MSVGVAMVTGASSGIGSEYARQLAQRGYDLILVARREERLEELSRELLSTHGNVTNVLVADLSKVTDVQRVADALRSESSLSLLVNNAGVMQMGPFQETTPREINNLLQINVEALVQLSLAAIQRFTAQGKRGTLVNVGSILGFAGYPGTSLYSATKAFVLSFTQGLQAEYAGSDLRVQLVAPAGVATEGWDSTQVDASLIMSARESVAASLKSLDLDEPVALPSVERLELLDQQIAASKSLMAAGQTGKPASRYR